MRVYVCMYVCIYVCRQVANELIQRTNLTSSVHSRGLFQPCKMSVVEVGVAVQPS